MNLLVGFVFMISNTSTCYNADLTFLWNHIDEQIILGWRQSILFLQLKDKMVLAFIYRNGLHMAAGWMGGGGFSNFMVPLK